MDLWRISEDNISADSELTYWLMNVSDPRCGVVIANHWLDVTPQQGWLGSCDVSIQVSDSLHSSDGTVTIHVIPIAARIYLPIIENN